MATVTACLAPSCAGDSMLDLEALRKADPPASVAEAVARLEDILDDDTKIVIVAKSARALKTTEILK